MAKRNHIQFLLDDTEYANLVAISERLDVPVSVPMICRNAVRRYIKDYMAKVNMRPATQGTGITSNPDLEAALEGWD